MAKQSINQGTAPTGVGGDTFRTGSAKLQANDNELYTHLGAAADGILTPQKTKDALGITTDNNNLTILIKDSLRQSVELASGGLQTVLYTAKGQPTYMNIIQKYDMSTIDATLSGTHPAFIVDGVEKPEIFIGTYQGIIKNGELLSLPNVLPTTSVTYDNFLVLARAAGNGHHMLTASEHAAIALQCYKNNTQPLGNSYHGRSAEDPLQVGRRSDGLTAGTVSGTGRTLTGSGPVQWRHNGRTNGIADLSGNTNEWNAGVRLLNGEIQIIEHNNAAKYVIDMSAASVAWKAIDGATGNLVTPNGSGTTAGTVKIATSGTSAYTLVVAPNGEFGAITNPSATPVSTAALTKLKALGLFPMASGGANFGGDTVNYNPAIETILFRGGSYSYGTACGVFYFNLGAARGDINSNVGSRPAFVSL